ncbi:GTPase Era [Mycoplasmopsis arginini]|uniref:GTPase Era n=1 Tax=Mycoplasmopsis arginini TaxID=2094 RepID=UPI00061D99DD|nr:GTPase Era [Mycoplasmopsis arginini]MDI3348329.1 GTPase Era [Mycoplasmopsis arginini]MDI3351265.1 GTPase Era [Mycoplasmopsis arginini]MDI3351787.1 GTPase Era [Mycoplasmopsis arginini]CRH55268.1 putative GTP-binding protein [Chlamydia trachomatis]
MKKICYVGLIGRPNVGKSTLINNILDFDLAIVSNLAQTTRDNIKGIYNDKESQIIFIDTPGIHKAEFLLSEKLNEKSYETIQSVDVVLFITPANEKLGTGDKFIINKIKETTDADLIAVITKVDLVEDKNSLDNKAQELKTLGFNKVLGVGKGFTNTYSDLIEEIKKYSYESEVPYEEDQLSDVSLRFIAKEIIRESAINNLYQEVPHSIAVQIDEFKENDDETFPYTIFATIFVKSESQKGIVIGQGGNKIKSISMSARTKMSKVFDHPVNLFLKVKVDNNWVDKEDRIKKAGY